MAYNARMYGTCATFNWCVGKLAFFVFVFKQQNAWRRTRIYVIIILCIKYIKQPRNFGEPCAFFIEHQTQKMRVYALTVLTRS